MEVAGSEAVKAIDVFDVAAPGTAILEVVALRIGTGTSPTSTVTMLGFGCAVLPPALFYSRNG